jgi:REP element-mobilizing transposase RayT
MAWYGHDSDSDQELIARLWAGGWRSPSDIAKHMKNTSESEVKKYIDEQIATGEITP